MKPSLERLIVERIEESIAVKRRLAADASFVALVAAAAHAMTASIRGGGTVFFFGNGGSAADAQHIAAELAGRYLRERPGLPGLALTTNHFLPYRRQQRLRLRSCLRAPVAGHC